MASLVGDSSSPAKIPSTADPTGPSQPSVFRLTPEVLAATARRLAKDSSGGTFPRELTRLLVTCRLWNKIVGPLIYGLAVRSDLAAHHEWKHLSPPPRHSFDAAQHSRLDRSHKLPERQEPIAIFAAHSGNLPLLQRLCQHLPIAEPDMTLLSLLSHRFSVPWQCQLGTHGVGLVDADLPRATILHAAVRGGHDHIVKWILEHMPHVDIDCEAWLWCLCPSAHMQFSQFRRKWQPSLCATPLHLALASGAGSTAEILMSRGAVWDREFTFTDGMTAPPTACRNALHDWPDEWGRSSLHYATFAASTRTGHFEVDVFNARNLVESLLRLGAIANTKDRGKLSRNIALERNQLRRKLDNRDRLTNNSNMAWTDRFRRGLAFMGEMWSLRPTPADYALRSGNSAVALAIGEASLIQAERA